MQRLKDDEKIRNRNGTAVDNNGKTSWNISLNFSYLRYTQTVKHSIRLLRLLIVSTSMCKSIFDKNPNHIHVKFIFFLGSTRHARRKRRQRWSWWKSKCLSYLDMAASPFVVFLFFHFLFFLWIVHLSISLSSRPFVTQSASHVVDRSDSQSVGWSGYWSVSQSVRQSANRLVGPSVGRPIDRSISLSVG